MPQKESVTISTIMNSAELMPHICSTIEGLASK